MALNYLPSPWKFLQIRLEKWEVVSPLPSWPNVQTSECSWISFNFETQDDLLIFLSTWESQNWSREYNVYGLFQGLPHLPNHAWKDGHSHSNLSECYILNLFKSPTFLGSLKCARQFFSLATCYSLISFFSLRQIPHLPDLKSLTIKHEPHGAHLFSFLLRS